LLKLSTTALDLLSVVTEASLQLQQLKQQQQQKESNLNCNTALIDTAKKSNQRPDKHAKLEHNYTGINSNISSERNSNSNSSSSNNMRFS
jgi:hypothetical protein